MNYKYGNFLNIRNLSHFNRTYVYTVLLSFCMLVHKPAQPAPVVKVQEEERNITCGGGRRNIRCLGGRRRWRSGINRLSRPAKISKPRHKSSCYSLPQFSSPEYSHTVRRVFILEQDRKVVRCFLGRSCSS